MGSSIAFYCGGSDNRELTDFARSIGLYLVAPRVDRQIDDDPLKTGPFCYLSLLPQAALRPYGEPRVRISDATDPMLGFMRGYFKDPYLVTGHISWSTDVRSLAAQTRPYYQQLSRWIRKTWSKNGDFYLGPAAHVLVIRGAKAVNFLPENVIPPIEV